MSSSGRNPSFGIIRRCFHSVAVSQAHNSRHAVASWRPVFNCESLARLASALWLRWSIHCSCYERSYSHLHDWICKEVAHR
jgi:hypothetical protein